MIQALANQGYCVKFMKYIISVLYLSDLCIQFPLISEVYWYGIFMILCSYFPWVRLYAYSVLGVIPLVLIYSFHLALFLFSFLSYFPLFLQYHMSGSFFIMALSLSDYPIHLCLLLTWRDASVCRKCSCDVAWWGMSCSEPVKQRSEVNRLY